MSIVHPKAFIARTAVIEGNVEVGARSSLWHHVVARADVDRIVIGQETNIQDGCILHVDKSSPLLIGDCVSVGHGAILHGCTIESSCLIGIGSVVLSGAVIGEGSVVAAGAVVPEGAVFPPNSLVLGIPARRLRAVDPPLAERVEATYKHYVALGSASRRQERSRRVEMGVGLNSSGAGDHD